MKHKNIITIIAVALCMAVGALEVAVATSSHDQTSLRGSQRVTDGMELSGGM